jgi:hypothetical protein
VRASESVTHVGNSNDYHSHTVTIDNKFSRSSLRLTRHTHTYTHHRRFPISLCSVAPARKYGKLHDEAWQSSPFLHASHFTASLEKTRGALGSPAASTHPLQCTMGSMGHSAACLVDLVPESSLICEPQSLAHSRISFHFFHSTTHNG